LSARSILIALALSAWILASAVTFLFVAFTSFFGIGVIGLIICAITFRIEIDDVPNAPATSDLGARLRAGQDLPLEQRRSVAHEKSLAMQSVRFFRFFGLGLAAIGLCGGLYYQL
jgi:hypothetical protein